MIFFNKVAFRLTETDRPNGLEIHLKMSLGRIAKHLRTVLALVYIETQAFGGMGADGVDGDQKAGKTKCQRTQDQD
ncbi:MAG: hypothetical protein KOO60_12960 [Gemmatimonadales bacterium]|nr:hypothetical protein [Gemmatimonadales bacterium]